MSTDTSAPRGSKGQMIYDRVEQIVKETGVTRSQAINQLAEELGDKPGTVAANFYRVARQHDDADIRPVRARKASRGDVVATLDEVIESLEDQLTVLRDLRDKHEGLDEELAKLRRIQSLLDS